MMKFRCQSCGHRIAVPPRMMGRLVNCPECGGVTHPFAEQLVAGSKPEETPVDKGKPAATAAFAGGSKEAKVGPAAAAAAVAAHQVRHCDNCGRLVGRLENSHVWRGNLVCVDCHDHLPHGEPAPVKVIKRRGAKSSSAPPAEATLPTPRKAQVLEARRVPRSDSADPETARPPSRFSLFLATKPGRAMLAICTLALGIYFVYSFLQVIGLVANLLVVGLLLLAALFFLFRPGPKPEAGGAPAAHRTLARRS